MNTYITGATIRNLRENRNLTQAELAEIIGISDKTVSKWETAKGLPDITLIEPLANALGVSVPELMSGEVIVNNNTCANIMRSAFYVCPLCGNVIHTMGKAHISCCGITLPPLEAEDADSAHNVTIEKVEDEHYVTLNHPMTKEHFISFIAYLSFDRMQFVKLYPEGAAESRFQLRKKGFVYICCNKHGLMRVKL